MSVVSGIIAGESSSDAADAQVSASRDATKAQLKMYEEGREDTAPWRKAGVNALSTLVEKINAGPGDYTKSPGYDFRKSEGEKSIERSAAARGGILSGATAKALQRYGQDYATNDYQNFLSNYYQSLTPYQSLAGIGQTTASQNASQGNQVASSIGQNITNAGNAEAAGYINTANAYTGAINSGVNNYMMWKYMNGAGGAGTAAAVGGATSPAYYNAATDAAAGSWLEALA